MSKSSIGKIVFVNIYVCFVVVQSGTTHLLCFSVAGRLENIEGLDVAQLSPQLQRVQLIKSQLPDPDFPPDTRTLVMHVDNVMLPAFTDHVYYVVVTCAIKLFLNNFEIISVGD